MVSWVVLCSSFVELTADSLRANLDQLYPGQFLPPREQAISSSTATFRAASS